MSTPPQISNAPSTSILSFERLTPTNGSFMSANKSPAVKITNKENNSPSKRKLNESGNNSQSKLTNSEILSVAHRILNKNNSNSAVSQPKCLKTTSHCNSGSYSAGSSVKERRSQFENKLDTQDASFLLTPKSIIKKFEQMSKDAGQVHQTPAQPTTPSLEQNVTVKPVAQIFPNLSKLTQHQHEQQVSTASKSQGIYSENIHPKSIIQKFEQMVKNNANGPVDQAHTVIPKSMSSGTNFSENNRASLTYISSVMSDQSPRDFDEDEEQNNDSNERTYKASESDTSEIYEEVSYEAHSVNNQVSNNFKISGIYLNQNNLRFEIFFG